MTGLLMLAGCCLVAWQAPSEPNIDKKYPLDPQLRQLAQDTQNPVYRKLVLEKMLITDLAAEWQRSQTADNPESFLKKHGGKEKVFANADLKKAYERRVQIRNAFLDLMRAGYKRYNREAPFDRGEKAEEAGIKTGAGAGKRLALAPVLPAPGAEKQWPRFRGPSGQGRTGAASLPTQWDAKGKNVLWHTKIPGAGNSSPIAWGEHIFLTSASPGGKERFVHRLRHSDGAILWTRQAPAAPPEKGVRDKNGFASATPVTDGERVIAFLGSAGLVCYDFKGNQLWHYGALKFQTTHGTAASPLLYRDLVILFHDQNQSESLCLALDKKTGKLVWSQKRKRAMGWSTPTVVHVGDHDELIYAGGETVKGYDPLTGKELWTLRGPTQEVVPTIVVGKDLLYSASGRNGPTIAFLPGGTGEVTRTHLVWSAVRGGPHVPTPLYLDGRLYTFNDTGIATCLDAETGKLIWLQRINDRFSASPIEAGGLIYVPAESGVTYVLRAGDRLDIVAENDLGAPLLASPAVIEDTLLLRAGEELFCIGARKPR